MRRSTMSSSRSRDGSSVIREHPLFQLALARMREFYREPEAVFWVFGFPIVLAFALGLAFRNTGPGKLQVGVAAGPGDSALVAVLDSSPRLIATVLDSATARTRLRTGRIALLVVPGDPLVYRYDTTRTESGLARLPVDEVVQRGRGPRLAGDSGRRRDPGRVRIRRTWTARREPGADDRGRVGTDEPRDAPDVDLVGDFLLLFPLPRRHDSVRQSTAADRVERRVARGDDRRRGARNARRPTGNRDRVGCRQLCHRTADLPLALGLTPWAGG